MSAHLEGELRGLKRLRVIRHLATCERCQAVLRSLHETVERLRLLGQLVPPPQPALVELVMDRVRAEEPAK
jgi:anti-sigma factor RsiW